jgi:hypothetical protein
MTSPGQPDENPEWMRAIGTLAVVTARKVDFVSNVLNRLGKNDNADVPKHSTDLDRGHARRELVAAVAQLDWELFVRTSEIERRKLNLRIRLEDLDREAIWKALEKQLRTT